MTTLGELLSKDNAKKLAMVRDIQRSDAKQPKQLMNELFGM